jgi:sec-independent protein translocase protein TatA
MSPVLAFLDTQDIILIGIVAMILFGATKLPKFARSLGQSVNEFKQGMKDPPRPYDPPAADKPEQPADPNRN